MQLLPCLHLMLPVSVLDLTHVPVPAVILPCRHTQVPGMDAWAGVQLHSHNFRGAAAFKGQRVLVVGASFSGVFVWEGDPGRGGSKGCM